MKIRPAILLTQATILALSLARATPARATPDFPGVVVQTLDLPKITIDPPQGCELCHTTDAGGTSLRPFGVLLQQYGVQPYQENTLEAALGQVQQNEPELIADIKAGKDPNDDPGVSAVPTPDYGCGTAPGRPTRSAWPFFLGVLAILGLRTNRAGTRRHPRR